MRLATSRYQAPSLFLGRKGRQGIIENILTTLSVLVLKTFYFALKIFQSENKKMALSKSWEF